MKENKKQLEVGDTIYSIYYGMVTGKLVIDRVTPTQAFSGKNKFKRQVDSWGVIKIIGQTWNSTSYRIETPEIKDEEEKRMLVSDLKYFNYSSLDLETLRKIHALLPK